MRLAGQSKWDTRHVRLIENRYLTQSIPAALPAGFPVAGLTAGAAVGAELLGGGTR